MRSAAVALVLALSSVPTQAGVSIVSSSHAPPASAPAAAAQPAPSPSAASTIVSSSDRGLTEQLNRILSHKPIRFYLKLVADPGFSSGIQELIQKGEWLKLLYVELGLFLAFGLIRAWRLSRTTLWYWHVWTKTWTLCLFWVLAFTVAPWVILGEPYSRVLRGVWDVAIDVLKR